MKKYVAVYCWRSLEGFNGIVIYLCDPDLLSSCKMLQPTVGEREGERDLENCILQVGREMRERERERESESESEWFIEKGRGPMSIVVTNTVKQP